MKREFRIGPGAASLILILVVLCMTILGVLALGTARSDLRLSRRGAELTTSYYAAEAEGEARLAALCEMLDALRLDTKNDAEYLLAVQAALPEGYAMEGRTIRFSVDAKAERSLVYEAELLSWERVPRVKLNARVLRDETAWEDVIFEENIW